MGVVPSSPRRRRRLVWFGIGVCIAAAIAGVALLVPDPPQPNPAPPKNAPPAQRIQPSSKVTRSERRAIDASLDRFLRAGLDRSSPATAWRLAGPEMKAESTLRQWRTGASPIPYFPSRQTTFHGWIVADAGPNYVVFDHLIVHPRHGPRTSSWIFTGEVVRRHSQWLVNRLYTVAVMQGPTKSSTHEVGPADHAAHVGGMHQVGPGDYAAPPVPASPPPRADSGALASKWLLAVGGLVGLALLFPLAFGIVSAVRSRRVRRRYGSASRELPPLPAAPETRAEPVGTGAGSRTGP